MKRYFALPFHGTPVLLVATFTFALLIAAKSGFTGIPLTLIIVSWFFKYCFVVLDSIVAGDEALPVLSIEMVNPVDEQRPLALVVLIVAGSMLAHTLWKHGGPAAGIPFVVLFTLVLPAIVGVLGLTRSALRAIYPPSLLALIRGLGHDYAWLNAGMLGAAGVVYWLSFHDLPLWTLTAVMQLLFLLVFCLVAGAIFEHRLELGIETRTFRERMAERDAREHAQSRGQMLDRAYNGYRMAKPREGWQEIEAWLLKYSQTETHLAEYHAVIDAAARWDDPRPADRLTNDLVALLVAKRATGDALAIAEQRLADNPRFQLSPPALAIRLAELAGAAGKRALQRQIAPPDPIAPKK